MILMALFSLKCESINLDIGSLELLEASGLVIFCINTLQKAVILSLNNPKFSEGNMS